MKDFKEFTFGWLIFLFLFPVQILFTYLYISKIGNRPMGTIEYLASMLTSVLICVLFYGLTTKITQDTISVSFGIGLIRKRIKLNRIETVTTVKSPWYYGWGIRIIPNGTLYNMSGADGVELKFNDTDRIVRIGTKNSTVLKNEIEKRLV